MSPSLRFSFSAWLCRTAWFVFVFPMSIFSPFELPDSSERLSWQIVGWIACGVTFTLPAVYWESPCRFSVSSSVRSISLRLSAYALVGIIATLAFIGPYADILPTGVVSRSAFRVGIWSGSVAIVIADLCVLLYERFCEAQEKA